MTDPGQAGRPYGSYGPYSQQDSSRDGYPYQSGRAETAQSPAPYGTSPYDAPPHPAETPKKVSTARVIGIGAGILVLLVALCGVVLLFPANVNKASTANAKVGDCVKTDTALDSTTAHQVKSSKIVKCDAKDAMYRIAGIVENKTEDDFTTDDNICDPYPTARNVMWQGSAGKTGKVFCLAPVK